MLGKFAVEVRLGVCKLCRIQWWYKLALSFLALCLRWLANRVGIVVVCILGLALL